MTATGEAFVIMQIGDPDLDRIYNTVMVLAIRTCGLKPVRVDKHNRGGLLKSEIIRFIASADVVIADLTNERPNCYLEVGYAMGLGRYSSLVLTAREDHNLESPNHKAGGSKIHFDLAGYSILFWNPEQTEAFREELTRRIRRAAATGVTTTHTPTIDKDDWIEHNRSAALMAAHKHSIVRYWEFASCVPGHGETASQTELLEAAKRSEVHVATGWPIGATFSRDDYRPKAKADGINAEIWTGDGYDYWAAKNDLRYYFLRDIWEERDHPGFIGFEARIKQIAEAILHVGRFYSLLGVDKEQTIVIGIRHVGLKDVHLGALNPATDFGFEKAVSQENESFAQISTTISEVEDVTPGIVERFTKPLFLLFDFTEIGQGVVASIVNDFKSRIRYR